MSIVSVFLRRGLEVFSSVSVPPSPFFQWHCPLTPMQPEVSLQCGCEASSPLFTLLMQVTQFPRCPAVSCGWRQLWPQFGLNQKTKRDHCFKTSDVTLKWQICTNRQSSTKSGEQSWVSPGKQATEVAMTHNISVFSWHFIFFANCNATSFHHVF